MKRKQPAIKIDFECEGKSRSVVSPYYRHRRGHKRMIEKVVLENFPGSKIVKITESEYCFD